MVMLYFSIVQFKSNLKVLDKAILFRAVFKIWGPSWECLSLSFSWEFFDIHTIKKINNMYILRVLFYKNYGPLNYYIILNASFYNL